MEQIIVRVKDKQKAKVLVELLAALDFVDSIKANEVTEAETESATVQTALSDFFALAGIWQGRDIRIATVRKNAWPRQSS